ncbi:MAG TPA: hypothetical protein VEB41_16490 [Burkholderiales bacterium]|nr:hypothetical protein [Burkholderiales bacterium]
MPQQTLAPAHAVPERSSHFIHALLSSVEGIRSVWTIGHAPGASADDGGPLRLLAFASAEVLERLRKCDAVHSAEVELLVVVDGDSFASAWGPTMWSGSLARWAWQRTAPDEAHYDESLWAGRGAHGGTVVRVRRKAFLVWRA